MTLSRRPCLVAAAMTVLAVTPASADAIFLSTQLRPVEEAQKVREVILKDFATRVDFLPEDPGPFVNRVRAEQQTGKVQVTLIGAQHGEMAPLADAFDPVDDVLAKLADRGFVPAFVALGKLGTEHQLYVPWMQATYIMAANKLADEHVPAGAIVQALTYDQIAEWGANIQRATGERRLGFPAGPKGLMHRFFQGYLYPAYTGGVVRPFKSADAAAMWADFKALWEQVSPRSTSYDFMQEPLLADEVWVAFDHVARLKDAFAQRPDDFVAFPAPAGPKGRGFMPVVAGLAIPKGTPDRELSVRLIDYLTSPEVQAATLREVAFYPVTDVELPTDLPEGVRIAGAAIAAQAAAADALPSLLPVGLGEKNGEFNKVYLDTFQRIVIRGQEISTTLATEGGKLAALMAETGAPCWTPDAPSNGPCPVE